MQVILNNKMDNILLLNLMVIILLLKMVDILPMVNMVVLHPFMVSILLLNMEDMVCTLLLPQVMDILLLVILTHHNMVTANLPKAMDNLIHLNMDMDNILILDKLLAMVNHYPLNNNKNKYNNKINQLNNTMLGKMPLTLLKYDLYSRTKILINIPFYNFILNI